MPPPELLCNPNLAAEAMEIEIDESQVFASHLEFGKYLSAVFAEHDMHKMLDQENDGLWDWLSVVYFGQLTKATPLRYWHYVVERRGKRGSLAYRQMVRTSYEMYSVHGTTAKVCLNRPMNIWGEMSEQLTSRQNVARHKGFMDVAGSLYLKADGKLHRGAAVRPKRASKRKPGDKKGFGGARRLAVALERLDRVFDTEVMPAAQLRPTLPMEFSKWTSGP